MRFQGDIEKLPKWAQRDIQRLEADLRHAEKQLREMMGESNEGTEVYLWEGQDNRPLPRRSQIRFRCDADRDYPHFDVSMRNGNLRIYGSGCFTIQPQSANSVDLIHEDQK